MPKYIEEIYKQQGLWSGERIGWLLTTSARRWPERELINFDGNRYSYHDLWRWVTQMALDFTMRGIKPGSRVLVQLGNCMELIVVQLACWRIGAICIPIIPIYRAHEVAHILRDGGPDVVIAAASSGNRQPYQEMQALLDEQSRKPLRLIAGGDADIPGWQPITGRPSADQNIGEDGLPEPAAADACMVILYTSGTTAAPKGVMLNSRALLCNLDSWYRTAGLSHEDVFCSGSPLGHIAALGSAC